MFITKLKTVALAGVILCVLGVGVGASFLAGQTPDGAQVQVQRKSSEAAQAPLPAPVQAREEKSPKADTVPPPPPGFPSSAEAIQTKEAFARINELEKNLKDHKIAIDRLDEKMAMVIDVFKKLDKELAVSAKAKVDDKRETRFFTLQHLNTADAGDTLKQLFKTEIEQDTLRMAISPGIRSIILQGTKNDLDVVEALVLKMERVAERTSRENRERAVEPKKLDAAPRKSAEKN